MFKSRKSKHSADIKNEAIRANHIHIPQKDAIAIVPPKKVIKALYDYNAPTDPPHYLSFSQGDFLHVVARENDQDWYEACNPLQGTRGLVPVKYFDTVGKTTRDSRGSTHSTPYDSGYSDVPSNNSGPSPAFQGHRMSKSLGKLGGAMVYGVVAYDFHAERPDELEAKEGEAIIVIAQSNPEWFVAKPITRLGGPGLIPVSFIDIKDMATGKTVTDPSEAIAKAGIPKVEEWKKMAADYKNTSIPLGAFGGSSQSSPPMAGSQQAMDRLSVGNQANGHARTPSGYQQSMPPPQSATMIAPVHASVPRFLYNDDKFHFIIECTMSNGSQWDLSRIYEDFYELQINLIKDFPDEAGQTGHQRTLPYMPGPVQFVTDKISEGRRENLDEYLQHLLRLGPNITRSALVCGFFQPRAVGDYEVDSNSMEATGNHTPIPTQGTPVMRQSQRFSQGPQAPIQHQQQQPQMQHSPQQNYQPAPHQRQLSSVVGPHGHPAHHRNTSDFSQTSASASIPLPASSNAPVAIGPALKVKVWFDRDTCVVVRMPPKGTFRFNDLYRKIIERRKLEFNPKKDSAQEENGLGHGDDPLLEIEYRDERDGEYYKLADDDELATALDTNDKLTLVVREVMQ